MNRRHFLSSSLAATASLALDLPGTLSAAATSPGHTGDLSELWAPSAQLFRSALAPGSGFSLHYEGHPAGPPDRVSERDMGSSIETTFRYASGIEAIRSLRKMPEYDAIEYSVRFRNSGGLRSGVIESVNAMHTLFKPDVLDSSYVLSSGGGTYVGKYPTVVFSYYKHFIYSVFL